MPKMTAEECRRVIERHQRTAPVSVLKIAHGMGLKVYKTRDWDDDMAGQIRKSPRGGPSGYAVFVNGSHHRNRRRFTLAHEIAHFVRHRQFIGDGVQHDVMYRSGLSTPLEREANQMATDILMPKHLLLRAFFDGVSDIDSLAERFRVSRAAMAIQLGIPLESPAPSRKSGLLWSEVLAALTTPSPDNKGLFKQSLGGFHGREHDWNYQTGLVMGDGFRPVAEASRRVFGARESGRDFDLLRLSGSARSSRRDD